MTSERPCCLYRAFDADDRLLYVGISINAITRLGQHSSGAEWWSLVSVVLVESHETRGAALEAEAVAIATERPVHNIARNAAPDPERAEARRLEREERDREIAEMYETYWFPFKSVVCTNCGDQPGELPKGVLVTDASCPKCDCVTLRLVKPVEPLE